MNPNLPKKIPLPHREPDTIRARLLPGTPSLLIDLIERMLEYAPQDRLTAREALEHPWFADVNDEFQAKQTTQSTSKTSKASSKATSAPSAGSS